MKFSWVFMGVALASSAVAGVRFQEASPLNRASGPAMVTLGPKGGRITALPAAAAVTPSLPAFDEVLARPSLPVSSVSVVSASGAVSASAAPAISPFCGDALALVRAVGLTMYAQRQHDDVMDVVMRAALAEGTFNRGGKPDVGPVESAVRGVPGFVRGHDQLIQAFATVKMACPPPAPVRAEVPRPD